MTWWLGVLAVVALAFGSPARSSGDSSGEGPPGADAARGRELYAKQCAPCHGPDGRGDGAAAYLLSPKPRDFRAGNYRLVSTWERVATDDDLFRTITRGIPGSAMPSWEHLSDADRRALVVHLRSFADQAVTVVPSKAPEGGAAGAGVVLVPPEPADSSTNVARARELFAEACASCHGAQGKGDTDQKLVDAEGRPVRPRDLTSGVFKTEPTPEALYRRIMVGLPGTPMPLNDWAYGDDGWYLVRYILSLSSPVQRERAEMHRYTIRATRVEKVPDNPDDGRWQKAEPVHLHLMPLWWRYSRPEEVVVQAMHDGHEIALLLVWADESHDSTAMRPQDFRDGAAVAFPLVGEPPFFAMGEPGAPVNVWMWKAERQVDVQVAFQDLETIYPNLGIDSYPDPDRQVLEQPLRRALTLASSPTFVTAWGAGNIVADPTRRTAVEDLRAEGFGTLRARPKADRTVEAHGVWGTGTYRVVLRRTLTSGGADAVTLRPGQATPAAFAIWDGAAGDRDGKKSVTIWQDLRLDP
jgi:mono/diheme cytochrome c family protein